MGFGDSENNDSVRFALLCHKIVVVKVRGRANFNIAPFLKELVDSLTEKDHSLQFVFDLDECVTMDSSFLGVLACIAIKQSGNDNGKTIIVNANDHTKNLIGILGLKHILTLKNKIDNIDLDNIKFQKLQKHEIPKPEKIAVMLEAHLNLANVCEKNESKFKDVIEYLTDSLHNHDDTPKS